MERFGFVGLPNSGKTSLHNALAGGDAVAARHAFSTKSANVGVARVPDARLLRLTEMSDSRRTVHASVQFTDIGGLVSGSNRGEGLGNAFLGHIRDTDAIVFVLRAFDDPDIAGDDDPLNSLRVLETELALADLDSAARQLDKLARAAKGDPSLRPGRDLLARAIGVLEDGVPLYRAGFDGDTRSGLRPFFLITNKPVLAVVNIGEDQIEAADDLAEPVRAELGEAEVMALCVQLEAEAAQLDETERPELLAVLGLGQRRAGPVPGRGLSPARTPDLPDHGPQGEPGLDLPRRSVGGGMRRRRPLRHPARFHPGRHRPLGPAAGGRLLGRGPRSGPGAVRGQGLPRGRRRRAGVQVQRLRPTSSALVQQLTRNSGRYGHIWPSIAGISVGSSSSDRRDTPGTRFWAMAWLMVGDRVVASLEIAASRRERRKGLIGRDGIEGALLLERTRSVHTFGMRFPIDVAHCDADMRVLRVATMRPNRVGRPVWRAASVIEAEAGSMRRWGVAPGVELEIRR